MSFESPDGIGNNGLWIANKTLDMASFGSVLELSFCFPGSGALSFLHLQACDTE